jgi:hypothetical protein
MSVVDAARRRESAMKAMPKPALHARGRRVEAEDRSRGAYFAYLAFSDIRSRGRNDPPSHSYASQFVSSSEQVQAVLTKIHVRCRIVREIMACLSWRTYLFRMLPMICASGEAEFCRHLR